MSVRACSEQNRHKCQRLYAFKYFGFGCDALLLWLPPATLLQSLILICLRYFFQFSFHLKTCTFGYLQDVIKRLKQIYFSVEDIDLFTGGLSEVPLKGALVGPTFACVIGIQFQKAKKCDRYRRQHNFKEHNFTAVHPPKIETSAMQWAVIKIISNIFK